MEKNSRIQEIPSPNSRSSTSLSTSSGGNALHRLPSPSPPAPQPHSIPMTRSDPNNPYPTTFVQADTSSFKQVVQMLTGSTEPSPPAARNHIPLMKTGSKKDKSGSKLYERRNSLKNFKISPLAPGYSGSPRPGTPEILSPSILDFPSLALSPVTPLIPDPFNRGLDLVAEDKAIQEKGFYLHPSPTTTPRDLEPRLLPLFPVTSPRVAGSSTAGNS